MDTTNRDIALALSGGGYRAAHFHLGVLRKLHQLELLDRVGLISSVSGGSILASLYVTSRLRNETFEDFEAAALRLLRRRTPLHWAVALDFVPFTSSGDAIERELTRFLRHDGRPILLEDLGVVVPRLVLNATNVQTGAGWRFKSGGLAQHWELGTAVDKPSTQRYYSYRCKGVTVARAVTASAAFPVFSAVEFGSDHIKEAVPPASPPDEHSRYLAYKLEEDLKLPLLLSDGGVRDNTGVTSVIAGIAEEGSAIPYVIVSDAGVEARPIITVQQTEQPLKGIWRQLTSTDRRGKYRKFSYLKRQFDIRGRHNNQMTSLLALTDYLGRDGHRGIAMFRIDRAIDPSAQARRRAAELHEVKTRLKRLDRRTEERLQQHGAQLLWSRLTRYTDLLSPDRYMPGVQPKAQLAEQPTPEVLS